MIRRWLPLVLALLPAVAFGQELAVEQSPIPFVGEALGAAVTDDAGTSTVVRMVVMLTALSFLPAVLLVMTPFTRFIIVFALLRQALGLQQSPPNQVLVGLALMLSLVVMQPTLTRVNEDAVTPYLDGQLGAVAAYDTGIGPMRTFMLRSVERDDLASAMRLASLQRPETLDDIPTPVVVTAFMLSELRAAFVIGIKVYIPFLVVDVVVASVLLGMGMMMLPPVVISMPFKLLLFVLIDGWNLLVTGLVGSVS